MFIGASGSAGGGGGDIGSIVQEREQRERERDMYTHVYVHGDYLRNGFLQTPTSPHGS